VCSLCIAISGIPSLQGLDGRFWKAPPEIFIVGFALFKRMRSRGYHAAPPEARVPLRDGGFKFLRTDFRFIFPRALRAFRNIEDFVFRVPSGVQYYVLCRNTQ
jgi:hypothetical protein